jgi:integrase
VGARDQERGNAVDPPRHHGKEIQPLTPEQARTLIDATRDHRLGAIVSVATALGLRQGEALGLRWQDVDFDAGTLSVRQALERSGGDSAARRPLAAERRELRTRIAATPKRSHARRELWQQLEANRAQWRKLRSESGSSNRNQREAAARSACGRS